MAQHIVAMQLSAEAIQIIKAARDKSGMKYSDFMSGLVLWLADQDDATQRVVLQHFPANLEADVARSLQRKLDNNKKRSDQP